MRHALSINLRVPLLATLEGGLSCSGAALRRGAIEGDLVECGAVRDRSVASKLRGGDMGSRSIKEWFVDIFGL